MWPQHLHRDIGTFYAAYYINICSYTDIFSHGKTFSISIEDKSEHGILTQCGHNQVIFSGTTVGTNVTIQLSGQSIFSTTQDLPPVELSKKFQPWIEEFGES